MLLAAAALGTGPLAAVLRLRVLFPVVLLVGCRTSSLGIGLITAALWLLVLFKEGETVFLEPPAVELVPAGPAAAAGAVADLETTRGATAWEAAAGPAEAHIESNKGFTAAGPDSGPGAVSGHDTCAAA